MRLFTAILKWSTEEVLAFLTKVRAEVKGLKKDHVHPQYN